MSRSRRRRRQDQDRELLIAIAGSRDLRVAQERAELALGVQLIIEAASRPDQARDIAGAAVDIRRGATVPLRAGRERVGSLALLGRVRRGRRQLLRDVIPVLGLLLARERAREDLTRLEELGTERAEQIAGVRRAMFEERDAERRDLERNLHDGAQHHLVALQMSLGLVEVYLDAGDPEALRAISGLEAQIERTQEALLQAASGVCPPLLADHGLLQAFKIEFEGGPGHVLVSETPETAGRRFPLDVETVVWFACLEAINNALKHAPSSPVQVTVSHDLDAVIFVVADRGRGLDGGTAHRPAFGLDGIRQRLARAGGNLSVQRGNEGGTVVTGRVPLPNHIPGPA